MSLNRDLSCMNPLNSSHFVARDLLLLTLFLIVLFGTFLGSRPLMVPDEGRYAEIPREMVESGDYTTPRLNYIKYFEKPPFLYWLEAGAIKVFGLNEWALRLGIALLAIFGCLMTYIAGLKLYDRRTGILACLILATSALYFAIGHFVIPDMPVAVWMSSCLILFMLGTREPQGMKRRGYFWGMFACAAMATLTKGLIGAVLPALIIFVWLCVLNNWRELKTYYLPSGLFIYLLIAAPWHILVQLKNAEFFHFYFVEQHFLRYLTSYASREKPLWFFPAVTAGGFFPWICFLIGAGMAAVFTRSESIFSRLKQFWRERQAHKYSIFLVLWVLCIFLFFLKSKSLLISYALPLMPPLAMLTARYLALNWDKSGSFALHCAFASILILGIAGGIIGMLASHQNHVQSWPGYVSSSLFLLAAIASAGFYTRCGVKAGVGALVITISAFLISINLSYTTFDTRSIKPLAMTLKPMLQADSEVIGYYEYYQDLPAYLERRVTVVGSQSELAFGMQYEDTSRWMVDHNSFWKRWCWPNAPRMFMIMRLDSYDSLKPNKLPLYPIAQTTRNILVTNKPHEN